MVSDLENNIITGLILVIIVLFFVMGIRNAVLVSLALATVLTLVVVPTLYALVYTTSLAAERGAKRVRRAYWAPFYRLTGTTPDEEESV